MALDLYVSYFLEDNPNLPNFFSFGFDTPRAVDGITKLLGVFLRELFTARGSDIYDLNAGTVLPNLIGGNVTDLDEAEELIFLAIDQAEQNVLRYQANSTLTQEERLGTVQLISIEELEDGDGVSAKFKLQNEAGRSLIAELPIT
jgi:hypothetical protein